MITEITVKEFAKLTGRSYAIILHHVRVGNIKKLNQPFKNARFKISIAELERFEVKDLETKLEEVEKNRDKQVVETENKTT